MDHRVAVPVEIQAFLPHRGSRQHERPERGVKRTANSVYVFPRLRIVADRAVIGVTTGEVLAHWVWPPLHSGGTRIPLHDVQPPSGQLQRLAQRRDQIRRTGFSPVGFANDVEEFVQNGRQSPFCRVCEHQL